MSAIFDLKVGHLEFDQVDIFMVYPHLKPNILLNSNDLAVWQGFPTVYPHLKPYILFNSNGLPIWHGFPVITHIKVKSSRRPAILNLIKLNFDQVEFFHGISQPETAHFLR